MTVTKLALPTSAPAVWLRYVGAVLLGVALMVLSAKAQIPFWPVPMTLHVLAVFIFAIVLGARMALVIFMSYLMLGALGYPVFAGAPARGLGLAYIMGPTGGYLFGFLVATWCVGTWAQGRARLGQSLVMLAGLGIIYSCGVLWLARFVPADKLLALGVFPFLAGDLVKLALVALMAPWLGQQAKRLIGGRS